MHFIDASWSLSRLTALTLTLVILGAPTFAGDEPLVPWGVYSVATEGGTRYEGEKLRAVLSYGETGGPEITVELIRVEMGYPSPSRVLWRLDIDIFGDTSDPCPIAEFYCASVREMRWSLGELGYDVVGSEFSITCIVSGIRDQSPVTTCKRGAT